jgi:hypothetical protein
MPSLTQFRTLLRAPASRLAANPTAAARQFQTSALRRAYKDDQDRESLKPKAHEYTQSGTDDQAAANEDAAFNPDKTSPEAAKETAGKGGDGNPLESSPANKDFAKSGNGNQDNKAKGGKPKRSGGGETQKNG